MACVLMSACTRVALAASSGVVLVAATTVAPVVHAAPTAIAGMIVFLDPGHNGANDASMTRQVPTGRGGTKDCQASGTSTADGFPDLPSCRIGLVRNAHESSTLANALAEHIVSSLDNLSETVQAAE